jgi:hypothetical protein
MFTFNTLYIHHPGFLVIDAKHALFITWEVEIWILGAQFTHRVLLIRLPKPLRLQTALETYGARATKFIQKLIVGLGATRARAASLGLHFLVWVLFFMQKKIQFA